MTNRLKSPESGVSRRDLLQAGGILATLVTLEGCARTETGSSKTQQSSTSENELIEPEKEAVEYEFNEADFEGWEDKTFKERQAVFDRWLESNRITQPMPEYAIGEGTSEDALEIVTWFLENRYKPLQKAYSNPKTRKYAKIFADDVLTCNGNKSADEVDYPMYKIICSEVDLFGPDVPHNMGGPFRLIGTTNIRTFCDDPDSPNRSNPGCVAMFDSENYEAGYQLHLWVELIFNAHPGSPNAIRAVKSGYSDKPKIKQRPDIEFYKANNQPT